jgi:hypothetical protein
MIRALALMLLAACGGGGPSQILDGGADLAADAASADLAPAGCALSENTTPMSPVTNGCPVLARNTSDCNNARMTAGLSGAWLAFSCRVTITPGATAYQVQSDGQPDYVSNYFPTTSPCWASYTPAFPDPNQIAAQSLSLQIAVNHTTNHTAMGLGAVGMAVNGVAIFDNQAAPGDDIFTEAQSFDRCGGHPAPGGMYHYHGEPYAISYDDASLIGVLRDGYFVYGRRDMDGSLPVLDAQGGHTGTTPYHASPIYHYHLNEQTSTKPGTSGQTQWFITTGTYEGNPG